MKTKLILIVITTLVLVTLFAPVSASAQNFKVVVNESNPKTTFSASELSRIFLKQTETGPSGPPMVPIDQVSANIVRNDFSTAIHNRNAAAIRAHWQRMIFSGQAVPPVEKASDAEVLKAVRSNPNAIGYVSESATIGTGVKTVTVTGQ